MGVELVVSGISCVMAGVSAIGTAGIWIRYLRESKGVISRILVDNEGNVQVSDLCFGMVKR